MENDGKLIKWWKIIPSFFWEKSDFCNRKRDDEEKHDLRGLSCNPYMNEKSIIGIKIF